MGIVSFKLLFQIQVTNTKRQVLWVVKVQQWPLSELGTKVILVSLHFHSFMLDDGK